MLGHVRIVYLEKIIEVLGNYTMALQVGFFPPCNHYVIQTDCKLPLCLFPPLQRFDLAQVLILINFYDQII